MQFSNSPPNTHQHSRGMFRPSCAIVFRPIASFSYTLLRRATLRGSFISDDFLAADLQQSRFVDARAINARFAAANLRESVFIGGFFGDTDFQGADLRNVKTERGTIGFGSQDHGGYYFSEDYTPGRIEWSSLFDPQLGVNDMLAAVGRTPTAEGGTFLVDFSKADFRSADIRGAQLQNSNIAQAQINQACADGTTRLPPGRSVFKPCDLSDQLIEKLQALRSPLQNNFLEKSCVAAAPLSK